MIEQGLEKTDEDRKMDSTIDQFAEKKPRAGEKDVY